MNLQLQTEAATLEQEKHFLSELRHKLNRGNVLLGEFIRDNYDNPINQMQIDNNLRWREALEQGVRYQEMKVRFLEVELNNNTREYFNNAS